MNIPEITECEPALRNLAHEAWTDAASMQVLVDTLLERGVIAALPPRFAKRDAEAGVAPRDGALFELECATREWVIDMYSDLELRVTGGWPDIIYVVHRNPLKMETGKGTETLSERVDFCGVERQPRLLRAP